MRERSYIEALFSYFRTMPEYPVVTVIFFRIKDGKYYFYLTKKGPNLPIMPSSWTPVGSVITKKDRELHSLLQNKYGDIAPDMQKRVTALRVIFERNLFHTEKITDVDVEENVHDIISKIDQELLNVWFYSMIPSGFQQFRSGAHGFQLSLYRRQLCRQEGPCRQHVILLG